MNEEKIRDLRSEIKIIRSEMERIVGDKHILPFGKWVVDTAKKAGVDAMVNVKYVGQNSDWRWVVGIAKDENPELFEFGTEINVGFSPAGGYFHPKAEVHLGSGSCGSYTDRDKGQVAKYIVQGALSAKLDAIYGYALAFENDIAPLRERLQQLLVEVERLCREDRENSREALIAEAEEELAVGCFYQIGDNPAQVVVVNSVTNKFVFVWEYRKLFMDWYKARQTRTRYEKRVFLNDVVNRVFRKVERPNQFPD